jgi:dimethylargininase
MSQSASTTAIVRGVPESFTNALAKHPRRIDLQKARAQHGRYVAALKGLVDVMVVIDPDEGSPDCPFVEDQVVVAAGRALITRSGHATRRGEAEAVQAALVGRELEVFSMSEPATLDGGDVMRVGSTLFVGRSGRTNGEGIARLAAVFGPVGFAVVPIDIAGLHLKSVCSAPTARLVLVAPDTVDPALFAGHAEVVVVPAEEERAANVVGVGRRVLMPSGCPVTREALRERGLEVVEVGTAEFRKADGALTCLSVVF